MNITSNISAPFIRRPVATSLLTIAILLAGAIGFKLLPVAPLPNVDFPTISVSASLPGASPETMASAVATPLERQFGRIASVTQMTSTSSLGSTSITLQFELNRDINAAARDVQAGINAALGQLPADLPGRPSYRKINPADASIMIIALTSDNISRQDIYDAADSILAQKLAQVEGVGQVNVSGGARPAVRVDANPMLLNSYGISLEQVRNALSNANANRPKGDIEDLDHAFQINTTDQLFRAREYRPLIVAYKNGAAVRLQDVAQVTDGVENVYNAGISNGSPAILIFINRQPGANIVDTVDRIYALIPQLKASVSPSIHLSVVNDRTTTIRASIHDVEITLLISIALVILVVFAFLRNAWATAIPSISVPLSLVGTFGVMYLLGYTLDNLSLMALTISTGFVVDDAIVVIENIARHLESGMRAFDAAMQGAREIGFTVISMSTSLIAVFIPILLMAGIVGRLFREFAVTLSIAIMMSLLVSLTTTPMMCARFLRHEEEGHGHAYRFAERMFDRLHRLYDVCLRWVLGRQPLILAITVLTVCVNLYLFYIIPKGFFPQQDTGRLSGNLVADQDTSFAAVSVKLTEFERIIRQDPAVDTVMAFAGSGGFGGTNTARMFAQLKSLQDRKLSVDEVVARLRPKLSRIPGATVFLQAPQDVSVGGRGSNAQFQYTLQADDLNELSYWANVMLQRLSKIPELRDANSDAQSHGLETNLVIDRDTAARLGVSMASIDSTLVDAFGQRQVSNIYKGINQYHVVLEVEPALQQSPDALKSIYVNANSGGVVPLSAVAHYETSTTPLTVNHQGVFPSITLSFNLAPGASLGTALEDVRAAELEAGLPATVHATPQGTAQAFQQSLASTPFLILTALAAVYIVLGVLYESYIHPITILSTLPSAGIGAILALFLFKMDLSIIAIIGIILLIGIVKKNAILMIDFAIQEERQNKRAPIDAIYQACLLRFRPIMMTTMAALFGAVPLAIGGGVGAELRRPLGITIVGGLIFSQMLTLFTTPVVYLYLDRFQTWMQGSEVRHPSPVPTASD
ncbi:MAG TPA: multidrug efflux RND transporter permease subunit [Candidatus Acidoferrales bacterium]|nr:multidrug efflux RND transporter permease subunit [Candidatus Acidoferrales bacterium]